MAHEIDIPAMARTLLAAAPKGSQVILFGSRARGDARPDSDVDFLVLEPGVTNRRQEASRLRRLLKGTMVGVDILVATPDLYDAWRDTPTDAFYDIAREGQRFAELD